ncbi:sialin-like [Zophobas morio]|uniref:sialin-like n=1 Tax=Zophobas morio TaxID=2755281 RepID=UPI00308390C1
MKAPPIRFWIAVMIFFTTFTNYMLRANMSVSIIKMVDRKARNFTPPCKEGQVEVVANEVKSEDINETRYQWNENEVGFILTAYFYGYIVTVMPGGILSEMLGPFHVILWTSLGSAILTAFTPLCAELGVYGVVANRFVVGLLGGVAYPAVNVLIAKWAPPKEKGKFLAAMMGNTMGTLVSFNMVGWATALWGWAWGFYVLVFVMLLFCVAFAVLVRDTPEKHPWISKREKAYIIVSQEGHVSSKKKVPPYRKIFTSIPFWVVTIAQFGNLWGLNLILSYGPKYLAETLGFNLKASAGLAALPYIARLLASQVFGIVGDHMRKKGTMSLTKIRKFFIIFSHFVPAACMFLIRAAGCHHVGVLVLLILNQAFNGAVVVSQLINPQDLAPNFSGTVFGMMNFFGMMTGIFVPTITGALNEHYDMGLMAATIIYMIGGIVLSICGLVFFFFGTAEVQPWNEIEEDAEKEDDIEKEDNEKAE